MQDLLQILIEQQYAYIQTADTSAFTPLARQEITDLAHYLELIKTWTTKIDLVSMQSDEMLVSRHIIDCVCTGKIVAQLDISPGLNFVDVGSGAGLPGIVLALLDRKRKVHLVEPRKKRCIFLQEAKQQLGLANTEIHEIDFAGFAAKYRAGNSAGIGLIIARAIGMRERYLKQAWKLVDKNGFVAEMLGAKLPELPVEKTVGGHLYKNYNFNLPPDDAKRSLWFWGSKRL